MRYKLTPGTQVREEDFGLLFYTMEGPRLFFMACGDLLGADFFQGERSLEQWVTEASGGEGETSSRLTSLREAMNRLKEKGVVLEC